MYHSIIFGDKNTWADWYLIPSSRPVFDPPEVKTKFVDVPGVDWHLDLSTVLTGDVTYGPRTGSFEFIVDNGQYSDYVADAWSALYSEIMNQLHGRSTTAILEDDPGFYYQGRFSINKWKSDKRNSKIVIDYVVSPFKYETRSSLEDWLWDTFNFENGIVREYRNLKVKNELDFVIVGRRMTVVPTFIVESSDGKGMKVVFNGKTYDLKDGTSTVLNIVTVEGENHLKFVGNGTISIDYRGGCL